MQLDTKPRYREHKSEQNKSHHLPVRFVLFLALSLALVLGGYSALHQYQNTFTGKPISEIKSGISNICLDVYHNRTSSGAKVDVARCNGRPSQTWSVTSSTIVHNGFCLTDDDSDRSNDVIVLQHCASGRPAQTWLSSYLDSFENPSTGQCLDMSGNVGSQLTAGPCNDLTGPHETWLASTWSSANTAPAAVNCDFSSEGEQIGCVAAKQWISWNSSGSNHNALLNTYSDGNGYEEWCADFVSYVYKQAGYPLTGGERDDWDEYVADDVQYDGNFNYNQAADYTPQPGDVAYFDYPGGHVEIVLLGGTKPIFVYGDSGTKDKSTGNGEMAENDITNDGASGQVTYYLNPGS